MSWSLWVLASPGSLIRWPPDKSSRPNPGYVLIAGADWYLASTHALPETRKPDETAHNLPELRITIVEHDLTECSGKKLIDLLQTSGQANPASAI